MTRSLSRISRQVAAAALAALALAFGASCGHSMMQQGDGSSYLIVDLLQAAQGAKPAALSTMLDSDVVTNVVSGTSVVPTYFDDPGAVTMHMATKDPTVTPTDSNTITLTGYHVDYVPYSAGAAVPASFDGALTATIGNSTTTVPFILVRSQAKTLPPLTALANSTTFLPTLARVTFFGRDQAGHSLSVTASIAVTFADWADPR